MPIGPIEEEICLAHAKLNSITSGDSRVEQDKKILGVKPIQKRAWVLVLLKTERRDKIVALIQDKEERQATENLIRTIRDEIIGYFIEFKVLEKTFSVEYHKSQQPVNPKREKHPLSFIWVILRNIKRRFL